MTPSIRDTRQRRDTANAEYEAQVVAAYHAGRSMAEIAREAGVSRQRVWKIIQDTPTVAYVEETGAIGVKTTTPPKRLVKLERRQP
jgi:predicted transcriptional regulator